MAMPIFRQSDDGSTVVLPLPGAFALELDENPTTGYCWHLECDPGLATRSSGLTLPGHAAPGAGGIMRWEFQASHAGEFSLQAKLWRQWLGDDSIVARFRLNVRAA